MKESLRSDPAGLLVAALIFVYVVLRAIFVPPHYDELTTFFCYVVPGKCGPWNPMMSTNNHVLNSLMTFFSNRLFGNSIFALRLPNVLSYLVFAYYLWQLKGFFRSRYTATAWFVTLLASIYLLSFFSLSRGYGISMAMLAATIYYLASYSYSAKRSHLAQGLVFASLAMWANLVLIPLVMLVALFFAVQSYRHFRLKNSRTQILYDAGVFGLCFLLPGGILISYTMDLQHSGALEYFGNNDGFFDSFLLSFPNEFAMSFHGSRIFAGLLCLYGLVLLLQWLGRKFNRSSVLFHLLFVSTIAGTAMLHSFFGVHYPHDRTTIHFYVLFITALYFGLDRLEWQLSKPFSLLPALLVACQLLFTLNLEYVPCWKTESVPYSFYERIKMYEAETGARATISACGLLGGIIDYYSFLDNGAVNTTSDKDFPSRSSDFLILNNWNNRLQAEGYDTLIFEPATGVALLGRQPGLKWNSVDSIMLDAYRGTEAYQLLAELPVTWNPGLPFSCDIRLKAFGKSRQLDSWIICLATDSAGRQLEEQHVDTKWLAPDFRNEVKIEKRLFFQALPAGTKKLKLIVWNVHGVPFRMTQGYAWISQGELSDNELVSSKH